MNSWTTVGLEGGIVQLAHPRTGSESVRFALMQSGKLTSLAPQHRVFLDHPYLTDPAWQVIVNLRNPFDMIASWTQFFVNRDHPDPDRRHDVLSIVRGLKEYLSQYTSKGCLFYLLDLADTVLLTERLALDWRDKVQARWPVIDIGHRNHVPNKRPWFNYYAEVPEAIDAVWQEFETDCILYERYFGRSVLPR